MLIKIKVLKKIPRAMLLNNEHTNSRTLFTTRCDFDASLGP